MSDDELAGQLIDHSAISLRERIARTFYAEDARTLTSAGLPWEEAMQVTREWYLHRADIALGVVRSYGIDSIDMRGGSLAIEIGERVECAVCGGTGKVTGCGDPQCDQCNHDETCTACGGGGAKS